jgi:hypothetical protein
VNRDFVIRQLLRAYRSGILSEAAFEEELARLEHGAEPGEPTGPGFEAFGRMYSSERSAVISFLDELHATQMDSAVGFAKWASVCRTKGLRTGLMIVAERKAYHARVIERRVHELGGELRATTSEEAAKLVEILANGEIPEVEKLSALTSLIQEPKQAIAPLLTFAAALNSDIETKQALRLLAEDELSSATWLHDIYAVISGTRAV